MKKSLLALAAMGAFAGAAQAQSSVTVYGILDVGYVGGNAKTGAINTTSGNQTFPKETVSFLGQSAQTTSRLGFRGTEDLGGGTSAFFTFETGLSPNSSTLSGFNNRQAFVGLAQKGIGRAAIGTQYTPIHVAVGATSAGQYNNIIGDVIYPQNTGLTNRDGSASNANAGYTVRSNNTINIQSERIAGFTGTAFYALNNKNENQTTLAASANENATSGYINGTGYTGGTTNFNGWGLGLNFNWQKLLLSANYQSFRSETAWTDRDSLSVVGLAAGATNSGNTAEVRSSAVTTGFDTNLTDNQMYLAGAYDFGVVRVFAQYIDRKVTSGLDSNAYMKRTAQQLGARGFVTKTVELWGSAGMGRYNMNGSGEPTVNFNGFQLGSNYWLSKRTNLYAIYGQTQTSSATQTLTTANGTDVTRNTFYNANNYAVGVRHTF